jgi:hypothetical protein
MSDRRACIGLFSTAAPLALPRQICGQPVLASASHLHDDSRVSVLLLAVHPLLERMDGPQVDALGAQVGATVAVFDPLYNSEVPPPWATANWQGAWVYAAGLLDDLLLVELRWTLVWLRQDLVDTMSEPVRARLLQHHHLTQTAHGVVVLPR